MRPKREMKHDDKCGTTLQRNSKQIRHSTSQMFRIFQFKHCLSTVTFRFFTILCGIYTVFSWLQSMLLHVLLFLDKNYLFY